VGSTPRVDRTGETVAASWDLEAYKQNPVVLYQHQHDGLPIGRAEEVFLDGEQLMFRVRFVPGDIYPFADTVRRLYDGGFMNAVSVGFRPLDVKGSDILHSELLELSAVAIPANADALLAGKADIRPVYRENFIPQNVADADPVKVKTWLSMSTKEGTTMTNATEPAVGAEIPAESAVEAALAEGAMDTKSLAELRDLLSQAVQAHNDGEMDTAKAAIEAAAAMVDVLMAEDDSEGTEVEIELPAESETIANPETKAENVPTLTALTKMVADLTARVDALTKPATKAHDEDPFSSEDALASFIAKQLGG
jgi:antitoxin component of MazEF toxin-antitoxin module